MEACISRCQHMDSLGSRGRVLGRDPHELCD